MEIKNLKRAAERIKKAIEKNEKIILFGDADMDGITSVIILKETIENLNGKVEKIGFPDREKDGYGLNEKALTSFKKYAPALLVVMDCGIGNFKEIDLANKISFEVIVIDHHEILEKMPNASIIVDPKQPGDVYPFKQLAAVGLVFYLSKIILGRKLKKSLEKNFLELTAMATIADMMPRIKDNKKIIEKGLESIRDSWRPGIQALFKTASLNIEMFNYLSLEQQIEKIDSFLNIPEFKNGYPLVYLLLTSQDERKAEKIATELFRKSLQKKEKIREIIDFLSKKYFNDKNPLIFDGDESWELILLGTVASVLCQKFQKPVFLYKKNEKESPGSIRAPKGINVVEALKNCSKFLITFGGHPQAAGFRVANNNLEKFKDCLIDYYSKNKQ